MKIMGVNSLNIRDRVSFAPGLYTIERIGDLQSTDFTRENMVVMTFSETELIKNGAYRFQLTPRQLDVALLISKGYDYKTVGLQLNISSKTVSRHICAMYEKLEVHNKMQLLQKLKSI